MIFSNSRSDIKNLQALAFLMLILWGLTSNLVFLAGFPLLFALLGFDAASQIRQLRSESKILNPLTASLQTVWSWFFHIHVVVLVAFIWVMSVDEVLREVWIRSAFAMTTGLGNWQQITQPENYFGFDSQTSPFIHLWIVNSIVQIALLIFIVGLIVTLTKSSLPLYVGRLAALGLFAVTGYLGFQFISNVALTTEYFLSTWTWLWASIFGFAVGNLQLRLPESKALAVTSDVIFFSVLASIVVSYFNPALLGEFIFLLPVTLLVVLVLASRNEVISFRIITSQAVNRITLISFGAFMWHWPLAQVAKTLLGTELLRTLETIVIVLGSYVIGFLSTQFMSKVSSVVDALGGLRQWTTRVAMLSVVPLLLFFFQTPSTNEVNPNPSPTTKFTPALNDVESDVPEYINDPKCKDVSSACMYGNKNSKIHLVLFGNEQSGNWQPTLAAVAVEKDWKLEVRINPSCPSQGVSEECDAWLEKTERYLKRIKPDVVFTNFSNLRTSSDTGAPQSQSAEVINSDITIFESLIQNKIKVVLLRGASTAPENPVQCLRTASNFQQECLFERASAYLNAEELKRRTVFMPTGVEIVDLTDKFCVEDVCFIANTDAMVIYRTSTLITKTFALTLSEVLSPRIQEILDSPISTRPYNCRDDDRRPECETE